MHSIRRATSVLEFAQATGLLAEYVLWMHEVTGLDPFEVQPEFAREVATLAEHYCCRDRVLFIAEEHGLVAGTVAVRYHDDGSAELKRMYVRPTARGCGLAERLLVAAMDHACEAGATTAWLESLRGPMDTAIAIYERFGFTPVRESGRTLPIAGIVLMEYPLASLRRCA